MRRKEHPWKRIENEDSWFQVADAADVGANRRPAKTHRGRRTDIKTDPLVKERIKIDIGTKRTHPQTDPDARKMQIDPKCEPIKM